VCPLRVRGPVRPGTVSPTASLPWVGEGPPHYHPRPTLVWCKVWQDTVGSSECRIASTVYWICCAPPQSHPVCLTVVGNAVRASAEPSVWSTGRDRVQPEIGASLTRCNHAWLEPPGRQYSPREARSFGRGACAIARHVVARLLRRDKPATGPSGSSGYILEQDATYEAKWLTATHIRCMTLVSVFPHDPGVGSYFLRGVFGAQIILVFTA
jgi:hypothetical protein